MSLPSTGSTDAVVLDPTINPLNLRHWQRVFVLFRDYYKSDGTVYNMADPTVGLGTASLPDGTTTQLFTPFAADGISIRQDLLASTGGTNQGFYSAGYLKPDSVSVTPDESVTQTPTAQDVRTAKNVLEKLEDKIAFEPLESNPVIQYLQYELPLTNIPALGTPGLIIPRGNGDVLQHRVIVLIGIDTMGQLKAKVFPHVMTDKKAKADLGRKAPDSQGLTYDVLPCPYAKHAEWTCFAGTQWNASGDFNFQTAIPTANPVTGLKVNVTFPTPIDLVSPTYTAQIFSSSGVASSLTLTSGTGTVSGGNTTVQGTSLSATTQYNGVQVTGTGTNSITATSVLSNPFTSTAS